MEKRTQRYEDRGQLERDVEILSDEGWVLEHVAQVSEDVIEAEFTRRPLMISDGLSEQPQPTT
ncbi:MAG: hypothetical protein M3P51_16520 [Chloroflexota bacterium]|nr:hypothetical protein [Chloroflexota bacterium]